VCSQSIKIAATNLHTDTVSLSEDRESNVSGGGKKGERVPQNLNRENVHTGITGRTRGDQTNWFIRTFRKQQIGGGQEQA